MLAYLPTTRLGHITNKARRRRVIANVFHAALRHIFTPLKTAGVTGLHIASGDGVTRRGHPLLAAHCGDHLEHIATVGCKIIDCPRCDASGPELGDFNHTYPLRCLERTLDALAKIDNSPVDFAQACRDARIKPIIHPYWEGLPFCNIFKAIPPDILHQLCQGLIKHLVSWIKTAYNADEIDARCRCMPRNCHLRHFTNGISNLTRVTGHEHEQMARVLLGVIAELQLPGGQSSAPLIRATRALLDFLFLAQYPVHSTHTLRLLEDALQRFHDNKYIFVQLGIRSDWNLPKLHFLRHYVALIKDLGTPDNFNTEYTERLHIDYAKDAYEATNRKEELPQMTLWLERREKILRHEKHIIWRLTGSSLKANVSVPPRIQMTKHPSRKAVHLNELRDLYGARFIRDALARFVVQYTNPGLSKARVERLARHLDIPFRKLQVYHKAKFWLGDTSHHQLLADEEDVIHARPRRISTRRNGGIRDIPEWFDTVLVNDGHGEYTGIKGTYL